MLKAYRKLRTTLRVKRSAKRMSELGQELLYALRNDDWKVDEYTIQHVKSGIELWIGGDAARFRIYSMPSLRYSDEQYADMLNRHDRTVLWPVVVHLMQQSRQAPMVAVLNALRLSQHKSETK